MVKENHFWAQMKQDIHNFRFTSSFFWKTIYVVGIFLLFLLNAFHEAYPDEFDNLAGGWEILHGTLLYRGYFTHHGPVPYFLAAFLEVFSGQSFVHFRIIYAIFLVIVSFLVYRFLKRQLGPEPVRYFPFYIFLFGLWSTYYWSHMLLADNIAAMCFVAVYALIILKVVYKQLFTLTDILFISIVSALGLYSSLTYLYLYIITTITTLLFYYAQSEKPLVNLFTRNKTYPLLYFAAPHIVWFLYLIVTWSLPDYYFMNYVFNTRYYIYNYPRPSGSTSINPIRYAVLIAYNFFKNYSILLPGVKEFNLTFPANLTMAVINTALFLYLLFRKHYKLALFVILVLIYANVRSNLLDSKETDYQSAAYIFISFFNLIFVLPALYQGINENIQTAKKLIYGFLLLVAGIYTFFCLLLFAGKFNEKYFPKYMGTAPLIYNRPEIAPIMNKIVSPNDYVWIGPFNFEDLFYTHAKFASKYQILIPGFGKSDKAQQEILADFERNKPVVVYFNKNTFILGSQVKSYSQFFLDYLDNNYITLLPYKEGNTIYRSVIPVTINMDLETQWYIRHDKIHEVLDKLIANGYIRKETAK